MRYVVSLYDYTGVAVLPWARAGFPCICFDVQHSYILPRIEEYRGGGSVSYVRANLHSRDVLSEIAKEFSGLAAFMMAFPVCTDLAVSGARYFEAKFTADPLFQYRAADHAKWCGVVGDALGCPYLIENPVSCLSSIWRKPDQSFDPFEYGGYIPEMEADHPVWPDYIAARDAYPKKTCIWTGGGFVMPERKPVFCPAGPSTQYKKLGGKSAKTKNIRSATPRGFAQAVFEANGLPLVQREGPSHAEI